MTYEPIESRVWREAFNAAIASCTDESMSPDRTVAHATKVADRALIAWHGRFPNVVDEQRKAGP